MALNGLVRVITLGAIAYASPSAAVVLAPAAGAIDVASVSRAQPGQGLVPGNYVDASSSYSIDLRTNGTDIVVVEPNKKSVYKLQPDGTYQFYNPDNGTIYGIRVVDDRHVDAFKPRVRGNIPTRLVRIGHAIVDHAVRVDDATLSIWGSHAQLIERHLSTNDGAVGIIYRWVTPGSELAIETTTINADQENRVVQSRTTYKLVDNGTTFEVRDAAGTRRVPASVFTNDRIYLGSDGRVTLSNGESLLVVTEEDAIKLRRSAISRREEVLAEQRRRTQDSTAGDGGLLGAVLGGVLLGATGADIPPMGGSRSNPLDMLNGLGNAINQQNVQQQSYNGGGSSSSSGGGAIIMSDTQAEDERRAAEEKARWDAVAERDRRQAAADKAATDVYYRQKEAEQANKKDCYGRPVSESSSSSSSSGATTVCPQ